MVLKDPLPADRPKHYLVVRYERDQPGGIIEFETDDLDQARKCLRALSALSEKFQSVFFKRGAYFFLYEQKNPAPDGAG